MQILKWLKGLNAKTQKFNKQKHIIIGGFIYAGALLSFFFLFDMERINAIVGAWFLTSFIGGLWEVLQWFKVIPGSANGQDALHSQIVAMIVTIILILNGI